MHARDMLRTPALMLLVLPVIGGCAAPGGTATAVSPRTPARTIAVIGRGVVKVKPDTFKLHVSIECLDENLDTATNRVLDASRSVIATLLEYPIDANRTFTDRLEVRPRYDDRPRFFRGYEAYQRIVVFLPDLSRAEALVLDVLRKGATGVRFDYEAAEGEEARAERARLAAVADAHRRATEMAAVLGERLGRPLSIGRIEHDSYDGGSGMFQQGSTFEVSDRQDTTWLAPDEVETTATVVVVFALAD